MALEKKQNLEKHIGEQIFDGDVLHAKSLGFRVWPLTAFSFDAVDIPRAVTEKHKNALDQFLNVAEELRTKDVETKIDLSPEDEGLVKRFGNIDSWILNVHYRVTRNSEHDWVTFTLETGLSTLGLVDRCLPNYEFIVDIRKWVKNCVTPRQSIIVGFIQPDETIRRKFHNDFFNGCSFTTWFPSGMLLEKKLSSSLFAGQQPAINISNYAAVMCICSDPSTISTVIQKDLRDYFVEVLATSKHECTFERHRDEKNPISIFVREVPSVTAWYREMLRHKTILDVCLAVGNHACCNEYILLWIIQWIPLMDYWSDYKITLVIQGVLKSATKVRESRAAKKTIKN